MKNINGFINKEEIICSICLGILVDPVECITCHHNFCSKCYKETIESLKKYNSEIKCAYCGKNVDGEWKVKKNIVVIQLLKHLNFQCEKCKKKFFDENEYKNHEKECKLRKCRLCKQSFYNEIFLNHLKEHKKELDEFIDVLNKNDNKKYLASNGLYYCYNKTNLNCGCCDGICHLGSCFCVDCMNKNKEFKGLKQKYLINKSGKAARYKVKSYYCKHHFFTTLKKNRSDFDKSFCDPPNEPCPDCKVLTKLMNKYLDNDTYNSVIIN